MSPEQPAAAHSCCPSGPWLYLCPCDIRQDCVCRDDACCSGSHLGRGTDGVSLSRDALLVHMKQGSDQCQASCWCLLLPICFAVAAQDLPMWCCPMPVW